MVLWDCLLSNYCAQYQGLGEPLRHHNALQEGVGISCLQSHGAHDGGILPSARSWGRCVRRQGEGALGWLLLQEGARQPVFNFQLCCVTLGKSPPPSEPASHLQNGTLTADPASQSCEDDV